MVHETPGGTVTAESDRLDVPDEEQPGAADPYDGPSPYDHRTSIDRTLDRLRALPGVHRRRTVDPDNPYRPELDLLGRTVRMRRRLEHVQRNAILVSDADELDHDDIDVFLRGGARFVPPSTSQHRNADGVVVLVERRSRAIVFLSADHFPVRAVLAEGTRVLASRLRAALGDDPGVTTGPPIDDQRWRGIGVAAVDGSVHVRLHTDAFDRTVVLEAADATRLAEILGNAGVPRGW